MDSPNQKYNTTTNLKDTSTISANNNNNNGSIINGTLPFVLTRSNTTIVPNSPSQQHIHRNATSSSIAGGHHHSSTSAVNNKNNNDGSFTPPILSSNPTSSNFNSNTNNNANIVNQLLQQQQTIINIDTNINESSSQTVYLTINGRPSIKLTFTLPSILNDTTPSSSSSSSSLASTNTPSSSSLSTSLPNNHIINLLIESADQLNQNSIVGNIVNNTRRYYFKGLINSIGKQPNMCEDSYFLSTDFTAIGVADGVGSWRSVGVDPGEYSRSLMKNSHKLVNNYPCLKPYELIEQAYNQSLNMPGSSTICILKLLSSKLYSGLVGDSSYLLIRKDKIVHRSIEQTHKPNHPFQLGQGSNDKPSSGTYMEHDIVENDIVVIGTDGFFDNIFDEEILEAIKKVDSIETFFGYLMELAKTKSTDVNAPTPFASRNSRKGGKIDDITVGCFVIASITK